MKARPLSVRRIERGTGMIGISKDIEEKYTPAELARLFGKFGHLGEVRVRYDRGNGDLTAWLPSSHHMTYVSKGWTAVEVYEAPEPVDAQPVEIPEAIAEHGRHDREGVWRRGSVEHISSCRNAPALIAKGWQFVGVANPERLRAIAEKKAGADALPILAE